MTARSRFLGRRHGMHAVATVLAVLLAFVHSTSAAAPAEDESSPPEAAISEPESETPRDAGRPTVVLDRLDFPAGVPYGKFLEKQLRHSLARAARAADWGAGSGARIEYRIDVTELKLTHRDGVLRVACTMLGRLPKGKSAKSRLSYGGSPSQARAVIAQVLEIVARGIVTRLAELERERRSQYRNIDEGPSSTEAAGEGAASPVEGSSSFGSPDG